jgi:hypothetical protein
MGNSDFSQDTQAKTLEDLFFLKKDKILIDKLRHLEKMKETTQSLSEVTGIKDEDVLQKLVELNIRPEIAASIALLPLIEVAWADGKVDEKEKAAVLEAASDSFVSKKSPDFTLLEQWLKHKPGPKIMDAWGHYIEGLCGELTAHQKKTLKSDLIGHAKKIAKAAGGFLGLGKKISDAEQQVIEKLESAFD